MNIVFSPTAWKEYISWLKEDKKTIKKINDLITDITRTGFTGSDRGKGKAEILKNRKAYSRKIDEANRLVYTGDENRNLLIISCKGHYED